jgi:hypothetical protein
MKGILLLIGAIGANPLFAQKGVDGPLKPEDLPARVAEEVRRRDEDIALLTDVRRVIKIAIGDSSDPNLLARLVHADSLISLRHRDHAAAEAELFSAAAGAAARIAEGWEARAGSLSQAKPGSEENPYDRYLKELDRRAKAISSRQPLSPDDEAELSSIELRRKSLRESIELYRRIKEEDADTQKYSVAADKIRAQERFFRYKAEDATGRVSEYDIACASAKLTLKILSERQSIRRELERFSIVLPSSAPVPANPVPVAPPSRNIN